jgi:hypothetical protein
MLEGYRQVLSNTGLPWTWPQNFRPFLTSNDSTNDILRPIKYPWTTVMRPTISKDTIDHRFLRRSSITTRIPYDGTTNDY